MFEDKIIKKTVSYLIRNCSVVVATLLVTEKPELILRFGL